MKTIGAIVFLLLQIYAANGFSDRDLWDCKNILPEEVLSVFQSGLPNENELNELCTYVPDLMDCLAQETKSLTGQTLVELALSDNETVAPLASTILAVGNILYELCIEDSELRQNYLGGATCFMDTIHNKEKFSNCHQNTRESLTEYYESLGGLFLEDEGERRDRYYEHECLHFWKQNACLAQELLADCGKETASTYLEIMERIGLARANGCTDREAAKTSLLDFLNLDEGTRSLYLMAFRAKK